MKENIVKIWHFLKTQPLLYLFIGAFLVWIVMSKTNNKTQTVIKNQEEEITRLKTHIRNISSDYRQSTPSLTPTPTQVLVFAPKEGNNYSIECFDTTKKQKIPNEYLNRISKTLQTDKNITYFCANNILNQAVFFRERLNSGVNPRQEGTIELVLVFLDEKNLSSYLLTSKPVSQFQDCDKILNWTDAGQIYFSCITAGGLYSNKVTYKINTSNKKEYLSESCTNNSCISYCDNKNPCSADSFCNLADNSCRQTCRQNSDCSNNQCIPYGPVKGCATF